jgi:hypothetical protein
VDSRGLLLPPSLEERGEMGRRCLGSPVGYSDVRGKRRVPWVEARIMAMYSGSCVIWKRGSRGAALALWCLCCTYAMKRISQDKAVDKIYKT